MDIKLFILKFANMKLSIIVPVYKTEKTLERCVRSILSQDFGDFELLLVDDGSPDSGGALADSMAHKDARIKVFHKENGGLSDARNYGLDRCRGEYITFADSDDELAPGTLGKLMGIIDSNPGYDMLEYPVLERPGRPDEHLFDPGDKVYGSALDWLAAFGLEHSWAWNKIYKRHMFDGVRFPKGRLYEDVPTLAMLLEKSPVIATTSQGMYLYHWNDAGIVATSAGDGRMAALLEAQVGLVKTLGIDTRQKRWHRLYLDMFTIQLHVYRATGRIMLHSQRITIRKYNSLNDCVKALMLDMLGLKLSCRLFKLLAKP